MRDLFAVLAYGPDKAKLNTALGAAAVLAEDRSLNITLLVPALKHCENTVLADVLGEKFVKNMVKGQHCTFHDRPVNIKSMQTVNPLSERGVVLALWGGDKMLKKVDACRLASAIVVLSWIESEVEPWVQRNNARVIDIDEA
ncbi:hypothetical protein [Arhodomonas aquaeolei]|uniref:hypothetical protein n=1 Tax=Arhodomonas aquaeolei TaxID=2369 RepID=UPI0012EB3D49|nr:hypothetical protein [Arhodomonas aquaeolei]